MRALRRILPQIDFEKESIPAEILNKITVTMNDFMEALKDVEPSAMREVLVEVPTVKWEDIGGLADVKLELQEAVEWPLKYPEVFEQADAKPPKGYSYTALLELARHCWRKPLLLKAKPTS